jgi:hypothetical protein
MTIETTNKTADGEFKGMSKTLSGGQKNGQSKEGILNSALFSAANTLRL